MQDGRFRVSGGQEAEFSAKAMRKPHEISENSRVLLDSFGYVTCPKKFLVIQDKVIENAFVMPHNQISAFDSRTEGSLGAVAVGRT